MTPGGNDPQIPGPLLLQAASANLAVLRNSTELSPTVKEELRQAAHDLRDATKDPARRDSVEKADTSLRVCLDMIQNGVTGETDPRIRRGIASVLGYLAQFLGGPPAPVLEALTDAAANWPTPPGAHPVAPTVELPGVTPPPQPVSRFEVPSTLVLDSPEAPSSVAVPELATPAAPKPRMAILPGNGSPALALQLVGIERQYLARARCIEDPSSTFAQLQAIERQIRKIESTARELLLSEAATQEAAKEASEVSSIGAWWLFGQSGQLEAGRSPLVTTLASIAERPVEAHRVAIDVVRLNPSHASTTDLWAALRGPALMPLRARCLPLLFENNLPDGEALVRMLDEPAMAMAAAAGLGWCRIQDGSRRLLERALDRPEAELSHALLFASVTQGDPEALSEVRIRLAAGTASLWLIDALAIAGDDDDAELLAELAVNPEMPAEYTLWALGHLGASTALGKMKALEARLGPVLVERAIELVAGNQDPASLAPGRYLDGQPWSVAALAWRLCSPTDLPLALLRWSALDLSVRTGEAAPCIYDTGSSTEGQQVAAQAFAACYAACLEPGPGGWYYFGRSLKALP